MVGDHSIVDINNYELILKLPCLNFSHKPEVCLLK